MSFTWTKSRRRTHEIVVRQRPIGNKTKSVADDIGFTADKILDAHRHKGHARIEVVRGKKSDAFVRLDDSRGDKAAAAIEFGHYNKQAKRFVPGIAPLRKAALGG